MYHCPMCGAVFLTPEQLIAHGAVCPVLHPEYAPEPYEPEPARYRCAGCGAVFYTPEAIAEHIRLVHGLPPPTEPEPVIVEPEATTWGFKARVYVYEPATGSQRLAYVGEVQVQLIEYHWGLLPDVLLDQRDTDTSGEALFNSGAYYPPAQYLVKAIHNASGDTYGVLLQTFEDGTWEEQRVYENV